MSRARNIKPGFFKNDRLADCEPLARILFVGLWCEADREGRLEDRPKRLKAEYLCYDNCDVEKLLVQLAIGGFILRYSFEGNRYIQILAFKKHQNPHVKECASTIPAPDEPGTRTVQAGLIPDSPSLIPDSIPTPTVVGGSRFEEFWQAYPVKKGRAAASAKWKSAKLDAIADTIIADVKRRLADDRQWRDGYIPHGSTYVNGRGWEDAIEPPKSGPASRDDDIPDFMRGAL